MKIIEQGNKNYTRIYKCKCEKCLCVFECGEDEMKKSLYFSAECPVCGDKVFGEYVRHEIIDIERR